MSNTKIRTYVGEVSTQAFDGYKDLRMAERYKSMSQDNSATLVGTLGASISNGLCLISKSGISSFIVFLLISLNKIFIVMNPTTQPDLYLNNYPGHNIPFPISRISDNLPRLYHYSKPGGFLGLVNSKSIWFSNIQYQNDGQEFIYALELLKELLETEYELPNLFSEIVKFLPGWNGNGITPVFTCSLTTEKDLLSQWRGYCPDGGYCYSIKIEQIKGMMQMNNLLLGKCVYIKEEQKQFIKNYILGISPEDYKRKRDTEPGYINCFIDPEKISWRNVRYFAGLLLNFGPFLKHISFKEESEWRLSTYKDYTPVPPSYQGPSGYSGEVFFREGINTLVPYAKISLLTNGYDKVNFSEIIVGPTPKPELAIGACKLLVSDYTCEITNSEIPYKTW